MANKIFTLDVISPAEVAIDFMAENGWIIGLAATLVIGAIIGIIVFNNKKNKGDKKSKLQCLQKSKAVPCGTACF